MRLFARAHLVRSPAAVSRMTVMRPLLQRNYYWGIVDEFKKNLQEDAELNALKEELKRETDDGFDKPEYHSDTPWQQWMEWYRKVRRTRAIWYWDIKYARLLSNPKFLAAWEKSRVGRTEDLAEHARLAEEARKRRTAEERDRVRQGLTQRKISDQQDLVDAKREKVAEWYDWAEQFRPADYLRREERRALEYAKKREEYQQKRVKADETHRKFMEKLKAEKLAAKESSQDEDGLPTGEDIEESKGLQEPMFPYAPESTALVRGPEKKGWEKMRENLKFNPKASKLYQKGLEFKERLEDSENVYVAKTMDTLGAAADVGRSGVKKVTGESETAAALRKLKEAWPHFDTNAWWKEQTRRLPAAITAFHERDFPWIKRNCNPPMFDILCFKSDEICKSTLHPSRYFYPFIVSFPSSIEIINATTDDPQRPYVLFKFSITKTAEKVKDEDLDGDVVRQDPKSYQPFNDRGFFSQWNIDWVNEYRIKKLNLKPLPPLGYDASRTVMFNEERKAEVRKARLFSLRLKHGIASHEVPRVDDLKNVKIVKGVYAMVLQYSPEMDRWLIHDFHEAKMDLIF